MQSPPTADPERRRDRRYSVRIKVHLEFQDLRCLLSGFALSMSPSGMFVKCDDPKPVGSRFEAEFRIGDEEHWIRAEGRVVWVQPATDEIPKGMGLRFHAIDPEGLQRVADLAASHARGGELGLSARLAAMTDAEGGPATALAPARRDEDDDLDDTVSLPPDDGGEVPTVELPIAAEVRGPLEDTVVMLGPEVMELPAASEAERGDEPRRTGRAGLIAGLAAVALASLGGLAFWLRGEERPAPPAAPAAAAIAASPLAVEPAVAPSGFTHVEAIQWSLEGEDTVVRIELDGALPPERLVRVRLDDGEPREVIQLLAAEQAYEAADVEVGSPGLRQIRTGFHQLADGNEQHIVLDLASPGCRVVAEEIVGNVLELRVSPPGSLGS